MVAYKVQHFVPQWYQRGFSPDPNKEHRDEHIWVFDIASKTLKFSTIYETAQNDYTYGKDGKFEQFLKPIEDQTSNAISILKAQNIDGLAASTRENIIKFVILQYERTLSAKVITGNFNRAYLEDKIKPGLKLKYKEYPDFIDSLTPEENLFPFMIKMALMGIDAITDLIPILVINETNIPFISSDNPVVKNNYYYSKIEEQGYQTPGLQFICPLTEKICLFLIHAELYKNIPNRPLKIKIVAESDVNSLNKLQILNCYRQILSKENSSEYFKKLLDSAMYTRKKIGLSPLQVNYADIKETNYQIHFTFLKNNSDAGKMISQYAKTAAILKKSRNCNPFRSENHLDKAYNETDKCISAYMEKMQLHLKQEHLDLNTVCDLPTTKLNDELQ